MGFALFWRIAVKNQKTCHKPPSWLHKMSLTSTDLNHYYAHVQSTYLLVARYIAFEPNWNWQYSYHIDKSSEMKINKLFSYLGTSSIIYRGKKICNIVLIWKCISLKIWRDHLHMYITAMKDWYVIKEMLKSLNSDFWNRSIQEYLSGVDLQPYITCLYAHRTQNTIFYAFSEMI